MKKDKSPNYIRIGILTVITTISWIFFSAYRTLTSKPAPSLSSEILEPFDPNLDTAKIDEMRGRTFFEEGGVQSEAILFQEETNQTKETTQGGEITQ